MIKRLSQAVIDSIAAGEVLERPANLVKELVENSLDAGSTEIEVDIADGGKRIRVIDNGHGIEKEDLALALERHATSKIKKYDDLWSLNTFGFRGEALASAAAVSRTTIISRGTKSDSAHRIRSEFGTLSEVENLAGVQGTTVQIEDLFENVPARLKFLKTDAAELGQIRKVMKAMALSRPEVTFKMKHRGELVHFWHSVDSKGVRAEQVLEKHPLYVAEEKSKNISVHVSFAAPDKGNRTGQNIWLFAQNRWIQDKTLFASVMDAYRSLLMHGEFPSVVVRIECAPGDIDVNVHPAKSSVKFRDGHGVYSLLHHTLRTALEKAPWAPHSTAPARTEIPFEETYVQQVFGAQNVSASDLPLSGGGFTEGSFQRTQFRQKNNFSRVTDRTGNSLSIADLRASATARAQTNDLEVKEPSVTYEVTPYWANLQVLGQANLTYIIAQSRQSLVVVDQHAAHERIAYERLMQSWRDDAKQQIDVQPYLLPLSLEMQPEEVEALMSAQDAFERLHISLDQGGPSTIIVRAAPAVLKETAIRSGLLKVASEMLSSQGSFAFEKIIGDLCATLACHSVIRAGQSLSLDEMKSLLAQMDEFPLSGFCPHGRPVYVEYPFVQMDRQFGRLV